MATYVHNELCLTPVMTSNTAPASNVTSASTEAQASQAAWKAFDQTVATEWSAGYGNNAPWWIKFDFGSGNTEEAASYTISASENSDYYNYAPKTWTLEGSNNDSDWDVLDTQTDVPSWTTGEMREYPIASPATYRYYKLNMTTGYGTFVVIGEIEFVASPMEFTFTNPIPAHLSTVYDTTEQVCLTTTISGEEPNYIYDADFYDEFDVQIGTTVSGIQSGQSAESNEYLSTPSGIDYSWYMTATSSGNNGTSSTYTFHNRFLASGTTEVNGVLTSGIDVRLYNRDTGELAGTSISTVSGIFNIETSCNTESYCVALSPYTDTNSLIYDFLAPGE